MTQTELPPPLQLNGRNTEGHDANGILDNSMLTNFIFATNSYSAQCGCAMDIVVFDNSQGAHICEVWQCPRCRLCLELHSSKYIKTPVVAPGQKFARSQPEINVRIAKASRDHGVGITDKTIGFMSESLGIKMSHKRNVFRTHEKVKAAISVVKERRENENLKEHNIAVRSALDYKGNIERELNGKQ